MTTESKQDTRQVTRAAASPLLGAGLAGAAAVLVLAVVAVVVDGSPGLAGALVGGLLTLAVFAVGTTLVSAAARTLPAASLLVALLTYTLQLLVLAVAVGALERSGLAGEQLSRGWFAAAVIAVTCLWLAGHVRGALRQRIPAFEDASRSAHPGGER